MGATTKQSKGRASDNKPTATPSDKPKVSVNFREISTQERNELRIDAYSYIL